MKALRMIIVCGAALLLGASLCRAEEVDSPRFQGWQGYKPGSSVTFSASMDAGGMHMEMEMKHTLVEVTDDHVTLDLQTSMMMNGMKHDSPVNRITIQSKAQKGDVTYLGEEDVQAMGKTFKCKVFQAKSEQPGPGGQTEEGMAKVWVTKDVPGGMVKMEGTGTHHGPGGDRGGTMSFLLKDFEAK